MLNKICFLSYGTKPVNNQRPINSNLGNKNYKTANRTAIEKNSTPLGGVQIASQSVSDGVTMVNSKYENKQICDRKVLDIMRWRSNRIATIVHWGHQVLAEVAMSNPHRNTTHKQRYAKDSTP